MNNVTSIQKPHMQDSAVDIQKEISADLRHKDNHCSGHTSTSSTWKTRSFVGAVGSHLLELQMEFGGTGRGEFRPIQAS